MTKVDKCAMRLAHCLACKAAAQHIKDKNRRTYWQVQVDDARQALQTALKEVGYDKPGPEQPPLIVEDIEDDYRRKGIHK